VNPFAGLRRVRAILAAAVALRAIAWGVTIVLFLLVLAAAIDHLLALSVAARDTFLTLATLAGLAAALVLVWRDRHVRSIERVALWVEERDASLEYRLATAIETGDERLVAASDPARWTDVARRGALRAVALPLIAGALAAVVMLLMPEGVMARIAAPRIGDILDRAVSRTAAESRLTPLVADIAPPAYSGEAPSTIDEPANIRALVGSTVRLRGRGDARGITAATDSESYVAAPQGERWVIAFRVPVRPEVLRLRDRGYQRLVAIEPIADEPPAVTLAMPAHDSILRTPRGRIALRADASDDFGIVSASFEYIISSGEGETFTFKSGTLGAVAPRAKETSLAASLSIDSLALKPGDVVHVRAVARDGNTISGPGVGASETRTIRIARADEYDSVAVDPAAPPDADKSMLSERMLITLAEALQKRRPGLRRDTVIRESRAIAADQKTLRRAVGEVVFTRLGGEPEGEEHRDDSPARAATLEQLLARADSATNTSADAIDFEGGESPVVAVNKPLLEAYNAMWDASTALEQGEPDDALPHMRAALEAMQRARQAERLYLRGRPPQVVVDVAKVRLIGKDRGASSSQPAPEGGQSPRRAFADRFTRLLALVERNPAAAADSLLVLRIDALGGSPAFAEALGDAAGALRRGRAADATNALVRARRALAGAPVARDSIARWGIIP
jgi:hypothetical protein